MLYTYSTVICRAYFQRNDYKSGNNGFITLHIVFENKNLSHVVTERYTTCKANVIRGQKNFPMAGLRRTWDKDRYEQLAKSRLDRGDEEEAPLSSNVAKRPNKEEFSAADKSQAGPMGSSRAFIKARQSTIDLEGKVGKTELIAPTDAVQARAAGFWCEVCSCLLKDSSSYLDHINGRKRKFQILMSVS